MHLTLSHHSSKLLELGKHHENIDFVEITQFCVLLHRITWNILGQRWMMVKLIGRHNSYPCCSVVAYYLFSIIDTPGKCYPTQKHIPWLGSRTNEEKAGPRDCKPHREDNWGR